MYPERVREPAAKQGISASTRLASPFLDVCGANAHATHDLERAARQTPHERARSLAVLDREARRQHFLDSLRRERQRRRARSSRLARALEQAAAERAAS